MGDQKYLSDLIGDEYKEWNNEKVILDCGTGRGKTTFIIKKLGIYAFENNKKVLYLCNRTKLKEQVELRLQEVNLSKETVTIVSYQKLQSDILYNICDYKDYDYVVADEIHYIFNDSTFNYYTDITYEYLVNHKDNVVIFMSATARSIFNWFCNPKHNIVNEKRRYKLEADYGYVNQVIFYERKELISIIDSVLSTNEEDKLVVFINDSDKMIELYGMYKDIAHFYCSENSKKLKSIREEDCITVFNNTYITFEKRILFTTIALDNGVDLKDEKIKYMISEIFEPDTAIQCLGRKRPINDNDTCIFYIADYNIADITRYNNNESTLKPLTKFLLNKENFIRTYGKKREWHTRYIYNDWNNQGIPKLNLVGYYKLGILKVDIMGMINLGYAENMCKFNMSEELNEKVVLLNKSKRVNQELVNYLNSIEGKPLLKTEQTILKEKVKNAGLKAKTPSKISELLRTYDYKFKIDTDRSRDYSNDGSQPTAWIVKRT